MKHLSLFKRVANAVALCLLLLLLVSVQGCSKQAKQEVLLIAGSSTMLPYMEKLDAAFVKAHPNVIIESDGGGSTAGIIAIKRNAIDIATTSRDIHTNEDDRYIRDYMVGKDAIIIAAHPSNPVTNLTTAQVHDIFLGTITNWNQVGGRDAPIALIGRKKGSTTRKGMDEMVLHGLDFAKSSLDVESAKALEEKVASTPNAIGYVALKDVNNSIKPLSINGVAVSRETILSGRYPLSRSFYLVIYDQPKTIVQKYVDFVLGKEGQTILEHEGLIKVN